MRNKPSLYLIDDHTCWVPEPKEYPLCKILSQFQRHPTSDVPMEYFQVSKLALFDSHFSNLIPSYDREVVWGYWGQYKPEREEEYDYYLQPGTHVIGRRYPEELSSEWAMLEFQKDMNELHSMIKEFSHTKVFGDKLHNGVNLPYRIYEALMCGVHPIISKSLLGTQSLDIGWISSYLDKEISQEKYVTMLQERRADITAELISHIKPVNSVDSVDSVLAQRATIYGSYSGGIDCRASILEALNTKHNETMGYDLPEDIRIIFGDLVLKLMRAASDPSHLDSWLDLAGYSRLIHEMMEEEL